MKVLVVDDDARLRSLLRRVLAGDHYLCDAVETGSEALDRVAEDVYDAIILDVRLPDMDGFEVCRRLRDAGCWAPIMMLTARDAVEDRVTGLDAGADDYVGKPFAIEELRARLRSLIRRVAGDHEGPLVIGDLTLDAKDRSVRRGSTLIALSGREFALLQLLMKKTGAVVTREEILDSIWGYRYAAKVVDVYVSYLRNKIDRPFGITSIQTVRGVGYRLVDPQSNYASA